MDFDHVRGRKKFDLARCRQYNMPFSAMKREVEKCEVVCANCHRIRTYNRIVAR